MRRALTGILALMVFTPAISAQDEPGPDDLQRGARNLKQVATAMIGFQVNHLGMYPPAVIAGPDDKPLLSWRVAVLPYLGEEEKALYNQFKLDEPWDSPHNKALLAKMPRVYAPVGMKTREPTSTFYKVLAGEGTVFDGSRMMMREEITDGLSRVIMIVEAGEPVPWTKPEDLSYNPNKPLPKLGAQYPGYFLAAFCDGAVRTIWKGVDEARLRTAVTPNSGDDAGPALGQGVGERLPLPK